MYILKYYLVKEILIIDPIIAIAHSNIFTNAF